MPNLIRGLRDPLQAQGFRTQRPEAPEDYCQPLYDRMGYAAAGTAGSISFFTTPLGGTATLIRAAVVAAVQKSLRDTNMAAANIIPGKLHMFGGISVAFFHEVVGAVTNADDREIIRENSYFEWKIGDKQILVIPLVCIPEINPIRVASTTVNNDTIIGMNGGGGMPMYKLNPPVTLNPGENLSFTLKWDGTVPIISTHVVDIQVFLHGYMRRPT